MVKDFVDAKLCNYCSPEQIPRWLKLMYPYEEGMRVLHETIYKILFVNTGGLLRKALRNCPRIKYKF